MAPVEKTKKSGKSGKKVSKNYFKTYLNGGFRLKNKKGQKEVDVAFLKDKYFKKYLHNMSALTSSQYPHCMKL